jgi:menaquinone-dependent protoporphyrinogen oxidase
MPKVLVAYATKMGSTKEIAEAIGSELSLAGIEVRVMPVSEVRDLRPHEAVVLGSALYARRWRPDAVRFLRRNDDTLAGRDVWLFHSGPCGELDKDQRQQAPAAVRRLAVLIGADPPVTFAGKLDPGTARGLLARWLAKGSLAGDFRDWDQIRTWAGTIACALLSCTGPFVSVRTEDSWRRTG